MVSCPDCDLLLECSTSLRGYAARCHRCGKKIGKRIVNSIDKALALSLAGLLIYIPSISLPLITLKSYGFSDSANILESISSFYTNGYYFVSFMVAISALLFPLVLLLVIFVVCVTLKINRIAPSAKKLFRTYLHLEEWAMIEVYLLGILITIIKMEGSSQVIYQPGFFCFSGLVLITLAISTVLDKELFWSRLDNNRAHGNHYFSAAKKDTTAKEEDLICCHTCNLLCPATQEAEPCPRCGEKLHQRKVAAISRTWALVLTSAIFFLPANFLPIMQVDFLGIPEKSTIMDGIIYFFQEGDYPIGFIIFTASVLVPVFKIVGLIILLQTTRASTPYYLKNKTKMYRGIAFIGRWSMLDIFVIALLTSLVDFGFFTSIQTAPAATYFCIVVASTMFAAITFDPRLIWDKHVPSHNRPLMVLKNSTQQTRS